MWERRDGGGGKSIQGSRAATERDAQRTALRRAPLTIAGFEGLEFSKEPSVHKRLVSMEQHLHLVALVNDHEHVLLFATVPKANRDSDGLADRAGAWEGLHASQSRGYSPAEGRREHKAAHGKLGHTQHAWTYLCPSIAT